jgi:RNA-directed DNA polymerase
MLDLIKERLRLIRLWPDQPRSCPVYQQMITKSSGWCLYHVQRKIDGGTDTNRNLILLHPECHRTARALGFPVVKPAHLKWAWKDLSVVRNVGKHNTVRWKSRATLLGGAAQ